MLRIFNARLLCNVFRGLNGFRLSSFFSTFFTNSNYSNCSVTLLVLWSFCIDCSLVAGSLVVLVPSNVNNEVTSRQKFGHTVVISRSMFSKIRGEFSVSQKLQATVAASLQHLNVPPPVLKTKSTRMSEFTA